MMHEEQESEVLIEQIKKGSIEAFDRFYDKYNGFVYNIALQILKKHEDAEDICHDIFLEINRKADSYNSSRGSIDAWLAIRTRSRCIDRIRREKHHLVSENIEINRTTKDYDLVETSVMRIIEKEALLSALEKIPKAQREVVYGNYFKYRTHKQLAEDLNRPIGTIKSLIRYGLKNIRKQLDISGWQTPKEGESHGEG